MKNLICIYILSLLFFYQKSHAQTIPPANNIMRNMHLTLEDKVNKSDVVVEGIVISEVSQWAEGFLDSKGNVFSSVLIRVSTIFKGEIKDTIIELIIDGGVFPSGKYKGERWPSSYGWLTKGYEGLFFLRSNKSEIQSGKNLQSYFYLAGSLSGFIYDHNPHNPIVHDDEKQYYDLEKELYPAIEAITKVPKKVIGLNSFEIEAAKKPKK